MALIDKTTPSRKMSELLARVRQVPPTRLTFVVSLLLSLIAVSGSVIVSKDAALYLHIAQQVLDQGPRAAFLAFDWPWFSFLIAGSHRLFALPLEMAAYFCCALFIAGTCALLVSISERFAAGSAYWACLVVLSIPAINQFRTDIIREHGFWFFAVLALGLALRWLEDGGWLRAIPIQLAIVAAALFRLEAALLLPAITLCLIADLRRCEGWKRLLQLTALPLTGVLIAVISMWSGDTLSQPRIAHYVSLADPRQLAAGFEVMANRFASAALEKYSADDAGKILFFGVTLTLLVKFLALNGPLLLPLFHPESGQALRDYWKKLSPFFCTWLAYFAVLFVFFIRERFINSRYVSFLNVLAVPLLAAACLHFGKRLPRLSKALIAAAVVVMLINVIYLGAKKTHYLEAATWLSSHTSAADPIYYQDLRIAYYAGRGYPFTPLTREELMTPEQAAKYRYFVLTPRPGDALVQWLKEQHKPVLGEFSNRKGDKVVIIGH